MKTEKVAAKLGIPYRTLDRWVRTGILEIQQAAEGPGTWRVWSIGDCVRAQAVKWLRQFVSMQAIRGRGIVDEITDDAIRAGKVLVFDASNGRISVMTRHELADIESYTMPGHTRLRFPLEAAAQWWRSH